MKYIKLIMAVLSMLMLCMLSDGIVFASTSTTATYVLCDDEGINHIFDDNFIEIMTYDNDAENYYPVIDLAIGKTVGIVKKHDLIDKINIYKYEIYDLDGKELGYELEMETISNVLSTSKYFVFECEYKYILMNKQTRQIKEIDGYNHYNKFGKYIVLSYASGGDVSAGVAICDENFDILIEDNKYEDMSYYSDVIVRIGNKDYYRLDTSYYNDKYGCNLVDENMSFVFPEPYSLKQDNYDTNIIDVANEEYDILFDVNKREIVDKVMKIDKSVVEKDIIKRLSERYDVNIKKCRYVKNNHNLIMAELDNKIKNIYNVDLELIFENIGSIDYLEFMDKIFMSKNEKTIIVDKDYNIIKTLEEDYTEFKKYTYEGKNLIIGSYRERINDVSSIIHSHILNKDYSAQFNDRFLISNKNNEDELSLFDYGLFLMGTRANPDYYKNKYNKYVNYDSKNNLIVYDFDFNIVKMFDDEYCAIDIEPVVINENRYFLSKVYEDSSILYDSDFNQILNGIFYINYNFNSNSVLLNINSQLVKYSRNFKDKKIIVDKLENLNQYLNYTEDLHGSFLYIKHDGQYGIVNSNLEIVIDGFDKLEYVDDYVIYYEKKGEKGYVDYEGNIKVLFKV